MRNKWERAKTDIATTNDHHENPLRTAGHLTTTITDTKRLLTIFLEVDRLLDVKLHGDGFCTFSGGS